MTTFSQHIWIFHCTSDRCHQTHTLFMHTHFCFTLHTDTVHAYYVEYCININVRGSSDGNNGNLATVDVKCLHKRIPQQQMQLPCHVTCQIPNANVMMMFWCIGCIRHYQCWWTCRFKLISISASSLTHHHKVQNLSTHRIFDWLSVRNVNKRIFGSWLNNTEKKN